MIQSTFESALRPRSAEFHDHLSVMLPRDILASSRPGYLGFLQLLMPIWVYLETQVEASSLTDRDDYNATARLRSHLLARDSVELLGAEAPFPATPSSVLSVFDGSPNFAEAVGILRALDEMHAYGWKMKPKLRRLGIDDRSGASFFAFKASEIRSQRERFAEWIAATLSEEEMAEATSSACVAFQGFLVHFSGFPDFACNLRAS